MIRFRFNPTKFASAAAYIASRKNGVTKKELCKLFFFSDQAHLLSYGRTITGDRYNALPQGPIPSQGLDMLNQNHTAPNSHLEIMRKFGKLNGLVFEPAREADRSVFSRSDLKILDDILDKFGNLSVQQLEDLSHKEQAWIRTEQPCQMDYDLFFEGHPEAQSVRQAVNAEYA